MNRNFVNFAFLQVVWFACVLGSAHGLAWLGPAVAAAGLAWHLASVAAPGEARTVAIITLAGAALETAHRAAGLVEPHADLVPAPFAPLWLTALWAVFATTPFHSMAWMRRRYVPAAVLGAIVGPAGYLGAERMDALRTHPDSAVFWAGMAPGWAVMIPLLLWLREGRRPASPPERDPQVPVGLPGA